MESIPLERRIELVRNAIARAKDADDRFRTVEARASATWLNRLEAKQARDAAEREFAYQWKNVDAIFEEKGIK